MKRYTVEVFDDGDKFWYLDGLCHREDGPACEYADGSKEWYRNNLLHREDGPAMEFANGDNFWYLNGYQLTEEEFLAKTQPAVELTVADIEKLLGKKIKIVKG